MRLKHILFFIAIICAVAEIGMALYTLHWEKLMREMPQAEHTGMAGELLLARALNIAAPAGFASLALLAYLWRVDSVGGASFFIACALHWAGLDLTLRAMNQVYGADVPLAGITWWVPETESDFGTL